MGTRLQAADPIVMVSEKKALRADDILVLETTLFFCDLLKPAWPIISL